MTPLIYGSDGGLYLLNNPDNIGANTWQSFMGVAPNGIRAVEFFAAAYDPSGDRIMGGSQDNGSEIQTALNNQTWDQVQDGDGQNQEYDPVNNIRYGLGNNFGNFDRAAGGGVGVQMQLRANGNPTNFTGLQASDQPVAGGFNFFQAHVPFILDVIDPTRILIGRNGLYESDPAAITPTGDVIRDITPTGMAQATALAFGGRSGGTDFDDVVLVGTTSGQLFFRQTDTNGDGTDFTNVSASLGGAGGIKDIVLDPQEWRRVYVLRGNQIFVTNNITDLVNNPFTNLTSNLGTLTDDVRSIELYDNTSTTAAASILLAGGYGGLFRRQNGVWNQYGQGLPNILVQDVRYSATDDRLIAGTMGRGAWTVDNVSATIDAFGILQICGDEDYPNQDDTFWLVLNQANPLLLDVFQNNTTTTPDFQVPLALVFQINVFAAGGNDNLIVDSSNGLIDVPNAIRYDGDHGCPDSLFAGSLPGIGGFDMLTLTQTGGVTQISDVLDVGATSGSGESIITGASGVQTVFFQYLEPVVNNVPSPTFDIGTVAGLASLLDAANAINYAPSQILLTGGRVTVDNFEPIEFENKVAVTINAGAGSDEINLNNPNTPTGLTGITVNGNDPTASDRLIVNGTTTVNNINYAPIDDNAATITGAGPVSISATGMEHVTINGQGGADTLTVTIPARAAPAPPTTSSTPPAQRATRERSPAGTSSTVSKCCRWTSRTSGAH